MTIENLPLASRNRLCCHYYS